MFLDKTGKVKSYFKLSLKLSQVLSQAPFPHQNTAVLSAVSGLYRGKSHRISVCLIISQLI